MVHSMPTHQEFIPAGPLVIDLDAGTATANGVTVSLQPQQLALLHELHVDSPKLVNKDRLRRRLWADRPEPVKPDLQLNSQVSLMRTRVKRLGFKIIAYFGWGYRLVAEQQVVNHSEQVRG